MGSRKRRRTGGRPESIILLQTSVGDYRQAVLELLLEAWPTQFQVLAGPEYFDKTLVTRIEIGTKLTPVRNHFLLGRRLLWQSGMWRAASSADVALLEFNPRILSVWVLLVFRKVRRNRSVLWGHAWPRSGRRTRTVWLRRLMSWLADTIIVYTESQARELRGWLPGQRVIAAPNAIYTAADMGAVTDPAGPRDIIFVGRLVPDKKPELLLDAFLIAAEHLPPECRLVFVGSGPLQSVLEERCSSLGVGGRIRFEGHVADRELLREMYSRAFVSVSPGPVGLAITQSFSFGVPMVIARGERHGPEIEAALESQNCVFVTKDSPESLANALVQCWESRTEWLQSREAIAQDCVRRYSADLMAERIIAGVLGG